MFDNRSLCIQLKLLFNILYVSFFNVVEKKKYFGFANLYCCVQSAAC